MTVAIKPLNLAELLAQNQELDMNRLRMAKAQRDEDRQMRLSDALGRYKYGTPEYVQELGKFDSGAATGVQNAMSIQAQNTSKLNEAFQNDIFKISAAGKQAIDSGANPQQVTQWAMSQLSAAHPDHAGQLKPDLFLQHLDMNAARGGYENPQTKTQQKINAELEMQQALMPGKLQLARETAAMRQTGSMPRINLPQGYRLNPETQAAERIPGLPVDQPKQAKLPPMSAIKGFQENHSNIAKIDRALAALKDNPGAVGFMAGLTPDVILQRSDPKGVDVRAKIADIGSMVIHERSGAAVTAAEYPRLKPFIPKVDDDPETIRKKLEGFKTSYEQIQQDYEDTYNEDTGYQLPKLRGAEKSAAEPSAAQSIPAGAITQTSPSTGKRRYSTDGGKTWTVIP